MINELTIKKDVIYSFISVVIIQIILKIITIGSKLVLAKLLIPGDFGLFAITLFIYTVVLYINDLGISVSAIREEKIYYGNVLLIQLVLAVILFILTYIFKEYLNVFNPRISEILPLFMVNLFLTAAASPPTIYVSKELKLSKNIFPRITQIVLEAGLSIWFAYKGLKIYSLIYSKIISNLFYTILMWLAVMKHLKIEFKFSDIKRLIYDSKYLFLIGFISIFATDISKAILSLRFSEDIVGMFFMVWSFIFLPSAIVEEPFKRICYPYLAKFKNDILKLNNFYTFITKLTMAVEIPIYLFLFFNIEFFICKIFPANRWNYSILIPLFKISLFLPVAEPFSMYGSEILKIFNKENIILIVTILVTLFITTVGTGFTYIFENFHYHGVLGMAFAHYLLWSVSLITIYFIYLKLKKFFWKFSIELLFIYLIPILLFIILNILLKNKLYFILLIPIIYFIYWRFFFKNIFQKIFLIIKMKIEI